MSLITWPKPSTSQEVKRLRFLRSVLEAHLLQSLMSALTYHTASINKWWVRLCVLGKKNAKLYNSKVLHHDSWENLLREIACDQQVRRKKHTATTGAWCFPGLKQTKVKLFFLLEKSSDSDTINPKMLLLRRLTNMRVMKMSHEVWLRQDIFAEQDIMFGVCSGIN